MSLGLLGRNSLSHLPDPHIVRLKSERHFTCFAVKTGSRTGFLIEVFKAEDGSEDHLEGFVLMLVALDF